MMYGSSQRRRYDLPQATVAHLLAVHEQALKLVQHLTQVIQTMRRLLRYILLILNLYQDS